MTASRFDRSLTDPRSRWYEYLAAVSSLIDGELADISRHRDEWLSRNYALVLTPTSLSRVD